tara:strand:- start:593 stop:769 length:177 start_codon:yes stop_codon:yes gene_type:complete
MTTLICLDDEQLSGIYELLVQWLQENESVTIQNATDEDIEKLISIHKIRRELAKRNAL